VPTYYVSRELLAAALRTELPDDLVFEAIPFPFNALVFMLPKGTVRHPTEGDCPFLVLSRTSKGQTLSLPIPGLDFNVTAEQDAVLVTTYMPEADFNVTYYKSVPLISGATIKQAFQRRWEPDACGIRDGLSLKNVWSPLLPPQPSGNDLNAVAIVGVWVLNTWYWYPYQIGLRKREAIQYKVRRLTVDDNGICLFVACDICEHRTFLA
jgi:hypothetical protein